MHTVDEIMQTSIRPSSVEVNKKNSLRAGVTYCTAHLGASAIPPQVLEVSSVAWSHKA